jgi:twitching motility protein PilT
LLLKKADGSGRVAVNEILVANAAVSAIIREGATQKLQDVIVSGKGQGMQFMDDAIFALLQNGTVTAHEAFMKAIDKNRFKQFLPAEEEHLGDAAGAVPADEKRLPGNFMKRAATRSSARRYLPRITDN